MTKMTRALGAVLLASTALLAVPAAAQDGAGIEERERGYGRGDGVREQRRQQARQERTDQASDNWAEQARAAQQARAQAREAQRAAADAQRDAARAQRDAWAAQAQGREARRDAAEAQREAWAQRQRRDNSTVVPGGRGAGFDPQDWHDVARERQAAADAARADRERDREAAVRERLERERDRSYGADRNGRYRDDWRDGRSGYRDGRYRDDWRYGDSYGRYDRWDRNSWRNDRRYDWQRYRQSNSDIFRLGRYYAPVYNYRYSRIGLGFHLGRSFYTDRYWINDPGRYRLPQVYGPYRWVRYYDDVLLVDLRSGQVVDVIYNFFW